MPSTNTSTLRFLTNLRSNHQKFFLQIVVQGFTAKVVGTDWRSNLNKTKEAVLPVHDGMALLSNWTVAYALALKVALEF